MQTNLTDKNDIKVFILFLMRNVEYPLCFNDINDIVVQDGVVNYFDFVECFGELLDTGNVEEIKSENSDNEYIITQQGIEVADNLISNIKLNLREKSLKNAMHLLSFRHQGSELDFTGSERTDGRYDMQCHIKERGEIVMKIDLVLDSKYQFDKMKSNFYEKPEIVYRGLLALLSGDVNYLIE